MKIIKIDKMKHIVFGVVLQPNVADLQGDIITEEEIEKAAHRYMIESRITGFRHESELDACIVESYISKNDEWFKNESVVKGSWLIAMKIYDEKVWAGVMDGTYNSFSIGGWATSTPIDRGVIDSGGGLSGK
jgi:hypothetical protein